MTYLHRTTNNPALEGYPPQGELDERIHHFQITVAGDTLQAEHVRLFGNIRGAGVLHKVESLYMDRAYNRLLVADEAFNQRSVKVYDLEGNFRNELIPSTYFTSEPEGIALYRCSDGSGYWIITDEHESDKNKFQVFDRETLAYVGTFKGAVTRNTDGVWLSQHAFRPFPEGAFFPVHNDGSVTAISWQEDADRLHLASCQ
ncbi:MAG: phytase [Balneolaceae bacterium]|nr:phytase [Balneolaceae bacterium]